MPQLIVNPGTREEYTVELQHGSMTIGRAESNSISILDKSLSRVHARLTRQGSRVSIEDLNSTNGTEVNGTSITRRVLAHGDSLRCGDVQMKYIEETKILKEVMLTSNTLGMTLGPGATAVLPRIQDKKTTAAERLGILLQVAEILSSPEELDTLLERIVDLLFQIMDVDRVVVLIVDEASDELRPRVSRTRDGTTRNSLVNQLASKPRMDLVTGPKRADTFESIGTDVRKPGAKRGGPSDGSPVALSASAPRMYYSRQIVEHVRQKNVAVLTADAYADPRFQKSESIVLQSIRASMCAPVRRGDKVLGVLYVDNVTTTNRYMDEDLEFLGAFANQAAIALENASLYKEIEKQAVLESNFLRFFPPNTIRRLKKSQMDLGIIETECTMLFADISEFTAMSATMQPREIMEMLNDYFPAMADIVFKYEGTLEKYIGDALLVAWGAPFAHDDDAERAVRAAIEMQHAMVELNRSWRGRRQLSIHIGVNTGPAAAGNIGSEHYIQYATIGDTTNVAARICGVANADEIVISASTLARVGKMQLPVTKLPPTHLKGKKHPQTLFRLDWQSSI